MAVLMDLKAMQAEIERLKAENVRLAARDNKALAFKVTEKGAVSVYGLQRFPVTLYVGQWERLAKAMGELSSFIQANEARLSRKD